MFFMSLVDSLVDESGRRDKLCEKTFVSLNERKISANCVTISLSSRMSCVRKATVSVSDIVCKITIVKNTTSPFHNIKIKEKRYHQIQIRQILYKTKAYGCTHSTLSRTYWNFEYVILNVRQPTRIDLFLTTLNDTTYVHSPLSMSALFCERYNLLGEKSGK